MKIIFIKDLPRIAKKGDTRDVADGYAINFLIPKKWALAASQENIELVAKQNKAVKNKIVRQAKNAGELATKLRNFKLVMKAKADETGKLYGSVTSNKIAEALSKQGHEVKPEQVSLAEHIKKIGNHPVKLQLDQANSVQILLTIDKE